MNLAQKIKSRIRAIFAKRKLDVEMDEEMRSHIELRTQTNIKSGMEPDEARLAAMREFGWKESIKETCRDQRGVHWIENCCQDVRFAARMLRRNPGFTFVAVLTLALGIGAISAVYSLVQGVLLTPPSYFQPQRVMLIEAVSKGWRRSPTTEQWTGWQKQSQAFQVMAAYDWDFDCLIQQDTTEVISGLFVTKDYFEALGTKPVLGRTFLDSEIPKNLDLLTSIIIGYDLWQRDFHGDPHILGQKIRLTRRKALTVVGVMPAGVRFLPSFGEEGCPTYDVNARMDYWLPVEPDLSKPKAGSGDGPWSVVGALRTGVTRAQGEAELTTIAARQAQADGYYKGLDIRVQPLTEFLNVDGRRLLLPLLDTVALVFLIACGNIAGLLLARGLCRQQEYAVRCALGAGRGRLFRQVLSESLLLALLGGVCGLALAVAIVKAFKAVGGVPIPRLDAVTVGWPALAFCVVAAVAAAFLSGILPALRASRFDSARVIKSTGLAGSASRNERRLLGGIAILQTALTLALLIGAGLLTQTVIKLTVLRPGYDTQNILTMSVMKDYRPDSGNDFHQRALERISALPGVRKVAFILGLPLSNSRPSIDVVKIEERPDASTLGEKLQIAACWITEQYFDVMGLKILEGRGFRPSDNSEGPLGEPVIINQAMAERCFPNENPVGKRLYFEWSPPNRPSEIIGIAPNSRNFSLTKTPGPEAYFSFWRNAMLTKTLVVRTSSDPRALISSVEHELRTVDPTVGIVDVKAMTQIRAESIASQSFAMQLLVGFALVGTVLALVGIYGLLSLSVNSRNREIAIRMAIGAQRREVVGLVLGQGLKLIGIGLLAGISVAVLLARVLRAFLFGVGPTDPLTFVSVAFLFTAVALLACYIPARRATKVDPMTALRHE